MSTLHFFKSQLSQCIIINSPLVTFHLLQIVRQQLSQKFQGIPSKKKKTHKRHLCHSFTLRNSSRACITVDKCLTRNLNSRWNSKSQKAQSEQRCLLMSPGFLLVWPCNKIFSFHELIFFFCSITLEIKSSIYCAFSLYIWPFNLLLFLCFTGLLCHLDDACTSNPCHQGAICDTSPINGSYTCSCASGYKGSDCSQDIDECEQGMECCPRGPR